MDGTALHDHCTSCYDAYCTVHQTSTLSTTETCPVILCPNGCSVRLHECKLAEHQDHTCSSLTVPCINSAYGCPRRLPRSKLGSHLARCPASVVTCSLEWNRLHKNPGDKGAIAAPNYSTLNESNSSDLLDLSLAARDQRLLKEALNLPPRLRRTLRNDYTKNFPAVPLAQRPSSIVQQSPNEMDQSTGSLDFLDEDNDIENNRSEYHVPGNL